MKRPVKSARSAAAKAHDDERRKLAGKGDVASFVGGLNWLRPLAEDLRKIVHGAAPQFDEAIKWGAPSHVIDAPRAATIFACALDHALRSDRGALRNARRAAAERCVRKSA